MADENVSDENKTVDNEPIENKSDETNIAKQDTDNPMFQLNHLVITRHK